MSYKPEGRCEAGGREVTDTPWRQRGWRLAGERKTVARTSGLGGGKDGAISSGNPEGD